jgi:ribonuclease R
MSTRSTAPAVTGTLRVHYRGFGFIETGTESFFAPAPKIKGLLDGDTVFAKVAPGTDQAQRVTLIERDRSQAVGEVLETRDGLVLRVDEALGSLTLPVPAGSPVGMSVLADITGPTARIIEVLGDPLDPQVLSRRVMSRNQLPWAYPDAALLQAKEIADAPDVPTSRGRRDLTGQLVITIDDDHSKDLDDAVSASPGRGGSVRVWVHIADVAEHVRPETALDAAAFESATSVYLPTEVRHMLPGTLATTKLSLIPQVRRDVVTVELLISADGDILSTDVYEAEIVSRRRVNYATVGRIITDGRAEGVEADVTSLIAVLQAAACKLGVARAARGGLDAYRSDPEPAGATGTDDAHLLIERLMVAANEAVAAWLDDRGMPALYRVHPGIDDEAAAELEVAAASLGLHASLPRPVTPKAMAALASAASRTVHADAFWDSVFRVLGRANYAASPSLHFGLGSERYLHFTSPLRRYADLVVHRMVKEYLAGSRDLDNDLDGVAVVVSMRSASASAAEKDLKRALALTELRVGNKLVGEVLSVTPRGMRVAVASTVVNMAGERGRVGERITLAVSRVDALSGRLEVRKADGRASAAVTKQAAKPATVTKRAAKPATVTKRAAKPAAAKHAAAPARKRPSSAIEQTLEQPRKASAESALETAAVKTSAGRPGRRAAGRPAGPALKASVAAPVSAGAVKNEDDAAKGSPSRRRSPRSAAAPAADAAVEAPAGQGSQKPTRRRRRRAKGSAAAA